LKTSFYLLFLVLLVYSCVPHKRIVYFQKDKEINNDTISVMKRYYKVKPGDLLSISVTSFNPEVTNFFNPKNESSGGFKINREGYIHIPMLDSVYVGGLTLVEIESLIKGKISEQVSQPYVIVDMGKFTFTALGEFGGKGLVEVKQNELTIIEAIALAGDMSDFSDRGHIKLIRNIDGKDVFITLNLNDRSVISSEYFYVFPNDVLYAEPLRAKSFRTNITQISFFLSLTSIAIVIYTFISNQTR
jgi:polysaccharide export outer membrane protein